MSPKVLVLAAALASSTALVPAFANQPADTGAPPPAATAPAQPPVPMRDKILFNLLDRNGDGVIDQDELGALTKAIFAAADTNGDGKISAEEFDKALPFGGGRPGMMMGRFMHHGPGGPGFDGPRFGGPGFGPRFGMDGHPHHPHWQQGQNDHGPGPGPQLGDDQGPQPADLGDDQGAQPPAGPHPDFASLDKNGDGVITPDEFQSGQPVPPAPAPQQ